MLHSAVHGTSRKAVRSSYLERGWNRPSLVMRFIALNIYVLGCKPEHRESLGL